MESIHIAAAAVVVKQGFIFFVVLFLVLLFLAGWIADKFKPRRQVVRPPAPAAGADSERGLQHSFVCPECGATEAGLIEQGSTDFVESNLWSGGLEQIHCAKCHAIIPAHLGERRDGLASAAAQREWLTVYRATQPREDE